MIIRANGRTFLDSSNEINPPALTDYQKEAIKDFFDYQKQKGETYFETANDSLVSAREYGDANGAAHGFIRALEILGIPCTITDAGEIEF